MPATTLQLTEIEAILADREAHQESVLLARNYRKGKQEVYLNERAREYLGLHNENPFRFNICKTIVGALSDEINLIGFSTDEETGEDEEEDISRPVAEWAEQVFQRNKLDSLQATTHKAALTDSESFIIVEWDPIEEREVLTFNPYLVETDYGGDGVGVYFIYENDDPEQDPICAVKEWIETIRDEGLPYTRKRRTIYYPDHFERWVLDDSAQWKHYNEVLGVSEEGETVTRPWYIENLDPSTRAPLGIPVFHFRNEDTTPEHWDGIPMQDAINKTLVDILAAGDLTAFRSYFGFGFYPTVDGEKPKSDGSNLMKMGPGQFNGTMKRSDEAALTVINGENSGFLMEQFKDLVLSTAQITETPASKFIVTAQIASDKTQKEQEKGLRNKAKKRRKIFSPPWVEVMNMARKLSNVFGGAGLSEEVSIFPIWEHIESIDELKEKKEALGIPIEQIWREAGYSETEIVNMKKESSYRVEFERKLWEGYNAASLNGVPLRTYLERVGIPKNEIEGLLKSMEDNAPIPLTDL